MQTVTTSANTAQRSSRIAPIVREDRAARVSDRLYDQLLSAIRDLRLAPGERLSETDLAEQLGVSRTPLREAIARLVDAGIVVVTPQVGTQVSLVRWHDVEEARFMREKLEVGAFEAAVAKPVADVSDLRGVLAAQDEACASNDYDAFFALDERLHSQIFSRAGYPGAWRAVQRTKLQLDRLRRLSLPEPSTLQQLIDDHRSIVDALEARDSEGGRTAISTHARRVLEYAPALRAKYTEYFAG